ncbi:hypothetical protein EXIGLDRAFT_142829 [Exidia glandulosa HHB12029]|uniref:Uncharacterized protein n=1 Tax=Exidia glandulosa HHB12029 TaxID=1314781 RepID=A0A165NB39_EXIGL|nr:hypothetical protein EXIGLDRAFT_142829 [Exidia glandulosa HHB12029]
MAGQFPILPPVRLTEAQIAIARNIGQLQEDLRVARAEVETLRARLGHAELAAKAGQELQRQLQTLQSRCQRAEGSNSDLRAAAKAAEASANAAQGHVQQLIEQINNLTTQRDTAVAERNAARKHVQKLTAAAKAHAAPSSNAHQPVSQSHQPIVLPDGQLTAIYNLREPVRSQTWMRAMFTSGAPSGQGVDIGPYETYGLYQDAMVSQKGDRNLPPQEYPHFVALLGKTFPDIKAQYASESVHRLRWIGLQRRTQVSQ